MTQASAEPTRPGALRISGEVIAVLALGLVGSIAGGLTGWIALSPVLGTIAALAGATAFLRREGATWRQLGFARRMPFGRFAAVTLGTLTVVVVVTSFVVTPVLRAFGAPPVDVAILRDAIEGNLVNYLIFLLPISWGTAAIGEELITRGFLLHRFEQLAGTWAAVVLQAFFFAAAHLYQGLTGFANIFALALIFGAVYVRSGRNLWPLIMAHGLIDTVGMTLLYLGHADLVFGQE